MPSKIRKRGESSYLLSVTAGYDGAGKQITYTKTIKATGILDAKRQYSLYVAEIEKGNTSSSGKMNLQQFCKIWLVNHAESQLAPKTVERYKQLINGWIVPALGRLQLAKLSPMHLLKFYANLEEDGIRKDGKSGGLSARTILHIHRLLHTILQAAVQWKYLNDNPVSRVKSPRTDKPSITVLNEEQTAKFIFNLDKEDLKWKTLSLLTLTAGLRLGESLGLEWQHISFKDNTVSIQQSSQYLNRVGIIIKAPKNTSSERLISLPDSMMELLKQYKAYQNTRRLSLGDKWEGLQVEKDADHDRLFTTWNGKPMYPYSFAHWMKKYCAKNELPSITPHGLRHLSATILINSGISLKNISARLGHNRTSTTADIYAHFLKSTDRAAANTLGDIMNAAQQKRAGK